MAKKLQQMRDMFEEFDYGTLEQEDLTVLKELQIEMGEISD